MIEELAKRPAPPCYAISVPETGLPGCIKEDILLFQAVAIYIDPCF
jgi:hypothetical protein